MLASMSEQQKQMSEQRLEVAYACVRVFVLCSSNVRSYFVLVPADFCSMRP